MNSDKIKSSPITELKGQKSARTTFKLTTDAVSKLDDLKKRTEVPKKSILILAIKLIFDSSPDKLDEDIVRAVLRNEKNKKKIRKTYVLDRSSINTLHTTLIKYKSYFNTRDQLMEYAILYFSELGSKFRENGMNALSEYFTDGDNGVYLGVRNYIIEGVSDAEDIEEAINEVFQHDPVFKKKLFDELDSMKKHYDSMMSNFMEILEEYKYTPPK